MKTKKIVILLCFIASTQLYCSISSLDFDEMSLDDIPVGTSEYDQAIDTLLNKDANLCEILTPEFIVQSITSGDFLPIKLQDLLQYNIYKYTNPPVIRILHDYPSLRPWYGCQDKLCLYGIFFLNDMPNAYFNRCPCLKNYLFIAQEDALIGDLEDAIPDIPNILPLFNTIRLQMHRLGVMLGASKCFKNLRFNGAVSLYYMAWNFYLTQTQIDDLNDTDYFNGGAPLPNGEGQNVGFAIFDPNTFINRYMVSDKVGFGDLRMYLDYMFCQETRCPFRIGGQLTLPLDVVLRHSIIGNQFSKCYPGPGLNLEQIACLILTSQQIGDDPQILVAKNELAALVQNYALQFINRLSATVLQNHLGQRYVSYGALFELFMGLTNYTNFCVFFEWDQFIKGHEDRPVRLALTPSQSLDRDYSDPALANDNLTFLQQRTINILYPPIVNIQVKSGDIFKFRFYSQTTWRTMQWDIGYDLWYQAKERVATPSIPIWPNTHVAILSAAKPAALQGKLFGHFNVIKASDYEEAFGWRLGLKGEGTINNFGIGKDWIVGLDFVADF